MPPLGVRLRDGHSTTITHTAAPALALWEIRIKPPGMDGGGPNNVTTMRNVRYRTKQPKKLITMTAITGSCAYDPYIYVQLRTVINVVGQMTITEPDGSTVTLWGWVDKFEPNEHVEGEQPTANFTFEVTNENLSGAEVDLAYVGPP